MAILGSCFVVYFGCLFKEMNIKEFIGDFISSLKTTEGGFSQRKIAIAGILTTVIIANLVYIYNCYIRNLFDSTFILWQTTMIGFISATFVALYGTKKKDEGN